MSKTDPTDLSTLLESRKQRKQQLSNSPVHEEADVFVSERLTMTETGKAHEPRTAKVGRPPGRRSQPNISPLNILLDEEIVAKARYKLSQINRGKKPKMTVSDLVENLLKRWIEEDK